LKENKEDEVVETSMEWWKLRKLGRRRRGRFCYSVWRSSQVRLSQNSRKEARGSH